MSFLEYYTVRGGIVHTMFQTAAVARGYVTDENEALLVFHSVLLVSTPAQLRALLVLLTVDGFQLFVSYRMRNSSRPYMMKITFTLIENVELAKNKCLLDLKRRFDVHAKDIMHACGFPTPVSTAGMT